MLCGSYMHKGQEGANVKVGYEFGNDSMKTCFEHKTKMKTNHRIKVIRIVFVSCKLWFLMEHFFSWIFMFGHAHILSLSLWFALT
jgi:hypothetical protein